MSETKNFSGDDWLRPPTSRETKCRQVRDSDTKVPHQKPRRVTPPKFADGQFEDLNVGEVIGSGSHGWVFAATAITSGQPLALKVLPNPTSKSSVRARAGFRQMSKLHHRGLMQLHQMYRTEQWMAFAMERIDGLNLTQSLLQWRKLSLAEACDRVIEMVRQVGSAIAWMHARNVIHRDLKPSNLMMTADGKRFVVIDYDLACIYDEGMDSAGTRDYLVWTPRYVAPEVLSRQAYSPASDIFSLGIVLMEALWMITRAARRRESTARVGMADGDDAIRRDESDHEQDRRLIDDILAELHPDIPENLIDMVSEMVASDPVDRPMAVALSRLGLTSGSALPILNAQRDSQRIRRAAEAARGDELSQVERWTHLILGGKVRRLHIDGASGVGKSTLLELVIERLRRHPWAQVFDARCHAREHRPLQAFGQIGAGIAARYQRRDRERIRVDLVTESILQRVLPDLAQVLRGDPAAPNLVPTSDQSGVLEAVGRAFESMRRSGPLFLIVDDSQWGDTDTLNLLDHLRDTSHEQPDSMTLQGLGVITASRIGDDRQRVPPDQRLTLQPMTDATVDEVLGRESVLRGIELSFQQRALLVREIEGMPYRLEAFVGELGGGELFEHAAGSREPVVSTIVQLWRVHKQELSPHGLDLLRRIAVAERQVEVHELSCLLDHPAWLLDELGELSRRHLIHFNAHEQSARTWHDRLNVEVLNAIEPNRRNELHHQWAKMLVANLNDNVAEIAEHFGQSGDDQAMLQWAWRAAREAQHLLGHHEAGRWYQRIADANTGEPRIDALRLAAQSFQRGGRLSAAADLWGVIADESTVDQRIEPDLEQVNCLVRSGRWADVREHVRALATRADLPAQKPAWLSRLVVTVGIFLRRLQRDDLTDVRGAATELPTPTQQRQIRVCSRLIPPLSLVDHLHASELGLFAGHLVRRVGHGRDRIGVAVGEAIMDAHQPGRGRNAAQRMIVRLQDHIDLVDEPDVQGDVCAGAAWIAALSGHWASVDVPASRAKTAYRSGDGSRDFETAHLSGIEMAAHFQLGRLDALAELVRVMRSQGHASQDQFVLTMSTLGFGAAGFLVSDQSRSLQIAGEQLAQTLGPVGMRVFDFLNQIHNAQVVLYSRDVTKTDGLLDMLGRSLRRTSLDRVQLFRILVFEFQATLTLQIIDQTPSAVTPPTEWISRLRASTAALRRERLDVAQCKADVIDGMALSRFPKWFASGRADSSVVAADMLTRARTTADSLQLSPLVSLADDQLEFLHTGREGQRLNQWLIDQGVVRPDRFARLYRGIDES